MASRLQDVILRDTRAIQPLATVVSPGTLYFVTDELVTERSNGTTWESYSGTGGTATIQVASVTLTDAEIKALPTTPITIVAAPGAGFYYDLLSASLALDNNAGAYTNIDTGATIGDLPTLQLQTGTGAYLTSVIYNDANMLGWLTGTAIAHLTGFLGTVGSRVIRLVPAAFADVYPNGWGILSVHNALTDHENQPINLGMYNLALGNLTGGNAANTMVVNITYVKVAVP